MQPARRAEKFLWAFIFSRMLQQSLPAWVPVCKDFVDPGTACTRRSETGRRHTLRRAHACLLRDQSGQLFPFDEACAQTLVGDVRALAWVPDFTVRDGGPAGVPALDMAHISGSAASLEAHLKTQRRTGRQALEAEAALRMAALRYLILRADKVASIPRVQPTVRFGPLDDIHGTYLETGALTLEQARRVVAIERSTATPPRLKTVNLLDVYTAHVKLEREIRTADRNDRIRFLRSLVDWLARHLVLSRAQIAGAGIELHPRAFEMALADDRGRELF